jgi:hypothetical protein
MNYYFKMFSEINDIWDLLNEHKRFAVAVIKVVVKLFFKYLLNL